MTVFADAYPRTAPGSVERADVHDGRISVVTVTGGDSVRCRMTVLDALAAGDPAIPLHEFPWYRGLTFGAPI
ncbi:hypothetical protein C357_04782 [Citreicella sp. 357]|nr:hypothetical protein C357_04782 [Citreicella sp. 357]